MREILESLRAETRFFFDYFLLRQSTIRERVRIDIEERGAFAPLSRCVLGICGFLLFFDYSLHGIREPIQKVLIFRALLEGAFHVRKQAIKPDHLKVDILRVLFEQREDIVNGFFHLSMGGFRPPC